MKKTFFILILLFIGLQFIPATINNPNTDKDLEIKAPSHIKKIFKRSCYDCHSNEVKIPWYQNIAPASFFIKRHVDLGRKWLNFSTWNNYSANEKDKKLTGIYRTVYAAMPLSSYVSFHQEAKLTKEEIILIREWTNKSPF